jgi:cystathionine gamma-lyase
MTRVANLNQGLETTFLDLENADEEQVAEAIRPNTKVSESHLSNISPC